MHKFFRFLLVGGLNTGLSCGIYWLLLIFIPYLLAYSIAYASGIVSSYFLNAIYVFQKQPNIKDFIKFPVVYVFQYFFGAVLLWIMVSFDIASKEKGMIFVIVLSVPFTFVMSRMLVFR